MQILSSFAFSFSQIFFCWKNLCVFISWFCLFWFACFVWVCLFSIKINCFYYLRPCSKASLLVWVLCCKGRKWTVLAFCICENYLYYIWCLQGDFLDIGKILPYNSVLSLSVLDNMEISFREEEGKEEKGKYHGGNDPIKANAVFQYQLYLIPPTLTQKVPLASPVL